MRRAIFHLLLLLVLAHPGAAGAETLTIDERAGVVEVIDGDTLVLDDGRQVRLVGIQAVVGSTPISHPNIFNILLTIWVTSEVLLFCLG